MIIVEHGADPAGYKLGKLRDLFLADIDYNLSRLICTYLVAESCVHIATVYNGCVHLRGRNVRKGESEFKLAYIDSAEIVVFGFIQQTGFYESSRGHHSYDLTLYKSNSL